ncbi:MAG: hypothetical protein IPJ71_03165 [Bdellovibrionales bacterium]|nr:hypothetical protein [Bdellovibrionales bacterium]
MKVISWAILLFLVFFASGSYALMAIEGRVFVNNSGLFLKERYLRKKVKISSKDSGIANDMQKLRTGDYISGKGEYDAILQEVSLVTLEFVGLQKLLGRWENHKSDIFDFKNFSQLDLYLATPTGSSLAVQPSRRLRYTIAPDSGSGWSILMVDSLAENASHSIEVESLSIIREKLRIDIFDAKTGQIKRTIHLLPATISED